MDFDFCLRTAKGGLLSAKLTVEAVINLSITHLIITQLIIISLIITRP